MLSVSNGGYFRSTNVQPVSNPLAGSGPSISSLLHEVGVFFLRGQCHNKLPN